MNKHTPGPWHVDGRDVCAWDGKIETTICECYSHTSIGRSNAEDNARLIAAAPDLLSALQECITDDNAFCMVSATDDGKWRRRIASINATARAAIANATP